MRLFSVKNNPRAPKKTGKKVLIITGVMLALFMAAPITNTNLGGMTAYAAEQAQGYNWSQEGQLWKVKDSLGNYVVNDWFKDANGNWYFMGADGVMQTGMLSKDGSYYYLGTDGRLVTVDGVYRGVNLVFNKDANSATYGAILSGVQELINTGVSVTDTNIAAPAQQQVVNPGGQLNIDPATGQFIGELTPGKLTEEGEQAMGNFERNRD